MRKIVLFGVYKLFYPFKHALNNGRLFDNSWGDSLLKVIRYLRCLIKIIFLREGFSLFKETMYRAGRNNHNPLALCNIINLRGSVAKVDG